MTTQELKIQEPFPSGKDQPVPLHGPEANDAKRVRFTGSRLPTPLETQQARPSPARAEWRSHRQKISPTPCKEPSGDPATTRSKPAGFPPELAAVGNRGVSRDPHSMAARWSFRDRTPRSNRQPHRHLARQRIYLAPAPAAQADKCETEGRPPGWSPRGISAKKPPMLVSSTASSQGNPQVTSRFFSRTLSPPRGNSSTTRDCRRIRIDPGIPSGKASSP